MDVEETVKTTLLAEHCNAVRSTGSKAYLPIGG